VVEAVLLLLLPASFRTYLMRQVNTAYRVGVPGMITGMITGKSWFSFNQVFSIIE